MTPQTARRTLQAVADGRVTRIYRVDGNVLKGDGMSSAALRELDERGLIEDGAGAGRVYVQVLTRAGRSELAANES